MKKLALLVAGLALLVSGAAFAGTDLSGASEPYLIPSSRVVPDFPPAPFAARFGSTVILRVSVQTDGAVSGVDVLDCTREMLGFEDSAIDAVRQWRFEPALLDGQPVASDTLVRVHFRAPGTDGARDGFIAASFMPAIGGFQGFGARNGSGQTDTSTQGLIRARRIANMKLPPTLCSGRQTGCMYDRRDLFPNNPDSGHNHPIKAGL